MIDKQRIDKLIDVYINDLESVTHDAGWEGDSILARVIEYGCVNLSSGKPGAKMEHSIRLLKGRHHDYPIIATALIFINPIQYIAVMVKNYYNGLHDSGEVWDEQKKAAEWQRVLVHFGMEPNPVPEPLFNYRYHLKKAYPAISKEIERHMVYQALISCEAAQTA